VVMNEAFGSISERDKKRIIKRRRKRNASISTHRILFATIHVHGACESAEDAWKEDEDQNESDAHLQRLLDRSKLIAEVINNEVIESSGAHLIEYRNDLFFAVLRLTKRKAQQTHSKIAYRFVCKLMGAADKLAQHDLQSRYSLPEGRKPHSIALSAGLAVGSARFLSLPITVGETAARPVTVISTCVRDSMAAERRMRYYAAGSSPLRPLSHAIGYIVKGKTHETLAISSFATRKFNPSAAVMSSASVAALLTKHRASYSGDFSDADSSENDDDDDDDDDENNNNNNNNSDNSFSSPPQKRTTKRTDVAAAFATRMKSLLSEKRTRQKNNGNDAESNVGETEQGTSERDSKKRELLRRMPVIARISGPEPAQMSRKNKINAPSIFPPK
jgi:hypothetical protein